MTKSTVRAHPRRKPDGSYTKVRRHGRTAPPTQGNADTGRASEAAADAARNGEAVEEWEDRPVTLDELRGVLQAVGCGAAAGRAPLVRIRRDENGTTATAAIHVPGSDTVSGFEIVDPFAAGDPAEATVNGRHLLDAIKQTPAADRKTLTAADIDVADGTLRVAGHDAGDDDSRAAAEARVAAEAIIDAAAAAGIDVASAKAKHFDAAERRLAPMLTPEFEDEYANAYAEVVELAVKPKDGYRSYEAQRRHEATYLTRYREWANRNRGLVERINAVADPVTGGRFMEHLPFVSNRDAQNAKTSWHFAGKPGTLADYVSDDARGDLRFRIARGRELIETRWDTGGETAVERDIAAWAADNGWPDARATLIRAGTPTVTDRQVDSLNRARQLLDALGDPGPGQVPAAAFADETAAVASAASDDTTRPVLGTVRFDTVDGQPTMIATDTYRLHMSSNSVPRGLSDRDIGLGAAQMKAWGKAAKAHLPKHGTGPAVSVSAGEITDRTERAFRGATETFETVKTVAGLHTGQTRTAVAETPGDFPSYKTLTQVHDVPWVTVDAENLSGPPRGPKRKHQPSLVDMRIAGPGDSAAVELSWRAHYTDEHQRRQIADEGTAAAQRSQPGRPLPGGGGPFRFAQQYLSDATSFAQRSGTPTVRLANLAAHIAEAEAAGTPPTRYPKPVRIEAPDDPSRIALVMPVNIEYNDAWTE